VLFVFGDVGITALTVSGPDDFQPIEYVIQTGIPLIPVVSTRDDMEFVLKAALFEE
jgi:hypothetical protein